MRTRLDIIFMECKQTIKLRGNTSCKVGQIQLMVQTLPRPNWIPPRVMVLLLYIESQNRDRRPLSWPRLWLQCYRHVPKSIHPLDINSKWRTFRG
jgi:hypothetical protein